MAVSYMDLKSKQTEAVAPRSLFGTSIEINEGDPDVDELEIQKANKKKKKADNTATYRPASADERLRIMKDAIERQDLKVRLAEGRLKNRQTDALQFTLDASSEASKMTESFEPKRTYSPYRTDVKHHSRDIALATEFNSLGLDNRCDYNYQRCRPRMKMGTYQEAGNVLTTGNLFTYKGKEKGSTATRSGRSGVATSCSSHSRSSTSSIPPNIKHIYGEQLCKKVKAGMVKESTQTPDEISRLSSSKPPPEPERDPLYDALGHALRQDIFNGVPYNKIRSLNTDSYTKEIHTKSMNDLPPKFAVQRNMDSKWAEDCIIRSRVMKAWDQMMTEKQAK